MRRGLSYRRMGSIEEACEALGVLGPGARILAGGTDLVVQLRSGDLPDGTVLLDISRVPGLAEIRETGDDLRVGARAAFADIALSPLVRRFARPLAEAAGCMGNPQVRNRATLGGNVCNASPCADSVPALVALGARLHFVSPGGDGWRTVEETIDGPYSTTVGGGALLTEVAIPRLSPGARTSYVRLARRRAAAKARMAVCVVVVMGDDGAVADVRIGCGSVTPRPHRMARAERVLLGAVPTEEILAEAASEVSAEMIEETGVRWSTEYKSPAVGALALRAFREALGWA